jgi:FdrA protein
MILKSEIRPGAYFDSIVLMQLQRKLAAMPGVEDAGVVMATPANIELLADFELLSSEGKRAGPDDLLIVVKAKDEPTAADALSKVNALLQQKRAAISQEFRPRSLNLAVKQLPQAEWVLISIPGRYAAGVAEEALELNKHIFLYSDNVTLEDEIRLKQKAQQKGLLIMGPDCGTAIINGIGLGFANRVKTGSIGLVGASGTGLQAITSHIHNLGGGISQAIGTGGRDLKAEVGAITAIQGLELLKQDEDTKVIVLVSKPPAAEVATKLLSVARGTGKPVVVIFIGYPPPSRQLGNLHFATSLNEAAEIAYSLTDREIVLEKMEGQTKGYLRGLFSGGTLAYQALLGLQNVLSPIFSNAPINKHQTLRDPLKSKAHTIVDLGEDVFTVGRLHPMLDNDLRIRRLHQEMEDPDTRMILLDVVLGEGAHHDPASELAPAIAKAKKKRKDVEFIAIVIGTNEDPQDIEAQIEQLEKVGVRIFRSTVEAVAYIDAHFSFQGEETDPPVSIESFNGSLAAIHVGLETFYESIIAQGAEAVHVDWRPPAGGDEKLMDILAKMKK